MAEAAVAVEPKDWEPRIIKISKKRQVTIPAEVYEKAGFTDCALATWTDEGFVIQPINIDAADETVWMLRRLLEKGYNGEELVDEYEKWRKNTVEINRLIDEGLRDIEEGRVRPADEMQRELRAKYGL